MERPSGITETTWAMCALNLAVAYAAVDWHGAITASELVMPSVAMFARFVVFWFYWNGYNWARVLVLLSSVVGLWNLTHWMHVSTLIRVVIANQVALSVFLLYWLNTPGPRRYFDPRPTTIF